MTARKPIFKLALALAAGLACAGAARAQSPAPLPAAYTALAETSVTASWTANGNPAGTIFKVKVSTDPLYTGVEITSATVGLSGLLSGLAPNTTYYGRVRVESAPQSAWTDLGVFATLPAAPGPAAATKIQNAALTLNWAPGGNPDGTVYEAQISETAGFAAPTTLTTANTWQTFRTLNPGTPYFMRVRAQGHGGTPSAWTDLPGAGTALAAPAPGGTPDYYNYPNYANSPLPVVTGGVPAGGIRKFVDSLPGLGAANANTQGKYIAVATPDQTAYPGSDYYVVGLADFTQQLHQDLGGPTKLRGYRDLTPGGDPTPTYLGPVIFARKDKPVRLKFVNNLGAGPLGDLFLPVDKTMMGAGEGPLTAAGAPCDPAMQACAEYPQNRATIHLHGGDSPWISDGTPHQWITPAGEPSPYKRGASQRDVPDMAATAPGEATFYYPNQQSGRMMFYHDHTLGLTRFNVYAGEVSAYLLTDPVEDGLISGGVLPDQGDPAGHNRYGIPLIIQDKTFVPPAAELAETDPTWDPVKWGGEGSLWFPHVYVPSEDPLAANGENPLGRWAYGPWQTPPSPAANAPAAGGNVPNLPNPSVVPESFFDTMLVNGAPYPYLNVGQKAYRFRVLNGSNDRFLNLQLYVAEAAAPTEVKMVPAVPTAGFPAAWPADGRAGGVPDPNTAGPKMIQIGTEGGFLSAPAELTNLPVSYDASGKVVNKTLLLGPAERADIIVDFSQLPNGASVILYNDAPVAFPGGGGDPRYDYFTGGPDLTQNGGAPATLPGYGPNTRTVMQFRVSSALGVSGAYSLSALQAAWPAAYAAAVSTAPLVPAGQYAGLGDTSMTFVPVGSTAPVTAELRGKAIIEDFDPDYGRIHTRLGTELPAGPVPFGYIDPPTEYVKNGEIQLFRVTPHGEDTHPVHFHMLNVQVVNRVTSAGVIKPPEPSDLGWKETVLMHPEEDTIVAFKRIVSTLPFEVPDSVRPLDPTQPPGAAMGFSLTGPDGGPVSVTNEPTNFGHESVWHCHILGHEEKDFMRTVVFQDVPGKPAAPTGFYGDGAVSVSFSPPAGSGGSPVTSYVVTSNPGGITAYGTGSPIVVNGLTNGTAYTFTVAAANAVGTGAASPPGNSVTPLLLMTPGAAAWSGLAADGLTANWNQNSNPAGTLFTAQLSTAAEFTGTLLTSATVNAWAAYAGLLVNTTYYGRVRTESATPSMFIDLGAAVTLANAPTGTAVTAVSSGTVSLAWNRAGNPEGTRYQVSYWTKWDSTETVKVSTESLVLADLRGAATYYVEVRAINHAGTLTAADLPALAVTLPYPDGNIACPPGGTHGEYDLPSGKMELDIPDGAFGAGVNLTVRAPQTEPGEDLPGYQPVNVAIQIDSGGRQPARDVTLTLPYTAADVAGVDPDKLVIAWFSEERRIWVPHYSAVNRAARKVTAKCGHFSLFKLFARIAAADLQQARVYPNPFRPAKGHTLMTFSDLTPGAKIRIYTMLGEEVRALTANASGMAAWDGRNGSGEKAASGVYLARIEGSGYEKTIKLAVQR